MPLNNFLNPSFNLDFKDLYHLNGLEKLQQKFSDFLQKKDYNIYEQFLLNKSNDSQLLIDVAKYLEEFLVDLFMINKENKELRLYYQGLDIIYQVKRDYIQRYIAKKFQAQDVEKLAIDPQEILQKLSLQNSNVKDLEISLSRMINGEINLEIVEKYCIWALFSEAGKKFHQVGSLFILPQKVDKQDLLIKQNHQEAQAIRGFDLIDKGYSQQRVHGESKYCLYCHKQAKDSCRTGLIDKNTQKIKIDELAIELNGCPLQQKISEMNLLQAEGFTIAALAVAVIDNPMIAGTGSRICNDCMKSCIFQNQDSVDIPQIETRILKDVLSLPYGFEIYSVLTKFNPLNLQQPIIKTNSGKKILVCGLGPAGYTLAHYLLNSGHEVVAIDGLKIEPLPEEISGKNLQNQLQEFKPIKFFNEIVESLSRRLITGFGGVVEYGITARFDKNFLKIIFLMLQRRSNFSLYGGIRFGSAITPKLAFEEYGFDHIALCIGAGRPHFLEMKNNFVKGVRLASDFLMSLQLSGAYKTDFFTNLQIRSPIIVIGGGLTAVDSATEIKAYYSIQLQKFSAKIDKIGFQKFKQNLNEEELLIAEEFLVDAKKLSKINSDIADVKIFYRKKLKESPAYRINHHELQKAIDQGIKIVDETNIVEIIIDKFKAIKAVKTNHGEIIPCRSLLIAIGTSPNLSIVYEDGLNLVNDGKYFLSLNDLIFKDSPKNKLNNSLLALGDKDNISNYKFINKIENDSKKAISFFGDLHSDFEGSVVKAMASAKRGAVEINKVIESSISSKSIRKVCDDFLVKIIEINRLSNHVVEIVVSAPLLALNTKIGQIFRLQNYAQFAKEISDQKLMMEGIAITALSIDDKMGIITGIVVETGGSTSLIKNFKKDEPCIFMGPSGKPTEIPKNETVIIIGGGRGNQPLTALAEAFSTNGCKVIFFAGYRKNDFIVNYERMKKSCAELIIAIEEDLANDGFFQGTVIDAIKNYFNKNPLKIDRIFVIGNDQLMHEIARLRHEKIIDAFALAKYAIASLNAPMQCMMKGVCAQCLQKKTNQEGEVEYFYSCANQDQNMDQLDFEHLHGRCQQNSLLEKANRLWLKLLEEKNI